MSGHMFPLSPKLLATPGGQCHPHSHPHGDDAWAPNLLGTQAGVFLIGQGQWYTHTHTHTVTLQQ